MANKRKASSSSTELPVDGGQSTLPKKLKTEARGALSSEQDVPTPWPDYFLQLERIFKALNTVIAFCSSRLIKQPLELARVAEIKALIPDIVRFAYVDHDSVANYGASGQSSSRTRISPDPFSPAADPAHSEHVLVLDFFEPNKNTQKIKESTSMSSGLAPLTQAQLKKVIEKRSRRFSLAVTELLSACLVNGEDPVSLVQDAAKAHLPVQPPDPQKAADLGHVIATVPGIEDRLPISDILGLLRQDERYRGQVVKHKEFTEKTATWGVLTRVLSAEVRDALVQTKGVTRFYLHQAAALNCIWGGSNVIVSTSTASGKSIIYQVPTLCNLEDDKSLTALFIYPTKALAQDQLSALQELLVHCPGLEKTKIATYDGDTPKEKRAELRESCSVIFTNFDTLHASILPNEDSWRRFLGNLRLVVVDELHYYSGLLGSHVALVARRLRRVCAALGNRRCIFVSCSATIHNPMEHMSNIFGIEDIKVITDDGAPSGHKDFLLWNPPHIDELDPSLGRCSAMQEACFLFNYLMKHGVRTILFCKIRRTCELVMKSVRSQLVEEGRTDILDRIAAYRGGYSSQDRRRIERDAFSGHLLGIVATNALELGVDIGTLDAVIMLGFPFGIASLRQQAGRAGRRSRDSLAILIADSLPMDQHYMHNPDEVFEKASEPLLVDLTNEAILESHLQCAADEIPIRVEDDKQYFGSNLERICKGKLVQDNDGWFHTHSSFKPYPASHVSLRGIQEERYTIVDVTGSDQSNGSARVLEEIELSRAIFETYDGGVFMHQGLTFLVKEVDHDTRIAKIVRADVNYHTRPRDYTDVDALHTYRIREIRGSPNRAFFGRIRVQTIVFGFFKMRDNTILDAVEVDSPPFERLTTGMWFDVPRAVLSLLIDKGLNPAEAIHAACHAVLGVLPIFVLTAPGDVNTECKAPQKEYMQRASQRKRPARLIFYDATTTTGACAKAFDRSRDVLTEALEVLRACECDSGCPSCIRSATCKEHNLVESKIGAEIVLEGILGHTIDPDKILSAENPYPVTIIEAVEPVKAEGVILESDETTEGD